MRATKQQPQSSDEESFIGRKWTFYLALVIVVVVVVGGVIAVVISRSKTEEPTAQPQPGTTISPQQDRSDWGLPYIDELGFRVEVPPNPNGVALDQDRSGQPDRGAADYAALPPAGVMWQKVQKFPLPFSTSDGPSKVDGALATGFTQTPQGAALAGLQLINRAQSSYAGGAAVLERGSVADSPELEAERITNLAAAKQSVADGRTGAVGAPFIRQEAYRLKYWSPDYAVIEYAGNNVSGNGWTTAPLEVVWHEGDWKLKLTDHPNSDKVGSTPTLAGWTRWPGK
ncbi:hypothetical protein [Rhodococcus qingshengii]|uniref:hypothetical protein n=1 Tax=Rhodococcus qingshengii TaxID=334542 RepID=UPI0030CF2703